MADMLEANRGVFRTAAWHGKGVVSVETIRDLEQFVREGNCWYRVQKSPALIARTGLDEGGNPVEICSPVRNQFHLVRDDDGQVVSNSTVTNQYGIISPPDIVDLIRGFCDEGFATPDAAFTLYDGQSEVISLRLDFEEPIDGDESDPWIHFLCVQNYHGTGKLRGKLTSTRPVCHNTVTAAFAGGADFALPHRLNIKDRVQFAVQTWERVQTYLREMGTRLGKLASFPVDIPTAACVALGIEDGDDLSKQAERRRDAIIAAARGGSPGTNGQTALDVFNAITWYTTHNEGGKGGKDERDRFASVLDGTRGNLQQRAAENLMAMANL